ncbi:hypothetical protein D9M69_491030 [compost metagenome]
MFRVVRNCSPPYSRSASARAVSVLPTPLGPTSRNTPTGACGSLRPTALVRRARSRACTACSWPRRRCRRSAAKLAMRALCSRASCARGMPVHWLSTSATRRGQTSCWTSRSAPGWAFSSACRRCSSSWASPVFCRRSSSRRPTWLRWLFQRASSSASWSRAWSSRSDRVSSTAASTARPAWRSRRWALSWRSPSAISPRRRCTAGGALARLMRTRAQAVSSRSTALSGSCRPLR